MKKLSLFLSLMVVLTLVLAACGGTNESNSGTGNNTGVESTGLPDTGVGNTGTTGTDTGIPATEPSDLTATETTSGLTATQTPMLPATETPAVATTETPGGIATSTQTAGGTVTGTQTTGGVLPPTGMADPARLSTLMTFDVRNMNGDVLADVDNMVIDLGTHRILHVIVASGGFLGIGEKLIPIPYEALQLNPACLTAAEGMGGTGSTGGTVEATATPGIGGVAVTETPVSGTDTRGATGVQAGMDSCYFLLNADDDSLRNAPNFDPDQLPDVNTPNWDTEFNSYWMEKSGAASTDKSSGTGSTGTAAGTATPGAGSTGSQTGASAQTGSRLILADQLIGMNVVAGSAATGGAGAVQGTTTPGTSGTGSTVATATPATGSSTGSTGTTGVPMEGETLGAITDAIVDLPTGQILYFLVTSDSAAADLSGMLLPVPPQAFTYGIAGDPNSAPMLSLNLDRQVLAGAPSFEEATLPNTLVPGWDSAIRQYWDGQNLDLSTPTTP